jgi:uncharacterized Ntn-hydrolase superfamily protein
MSGKSFPRIAAPIPKEVVMSQYHKGIRALAGIIVVSSIILTPRIASATFSIVAVDTLTGAVGGAGASCIANSFIINDVVESLGALHTQAFWIQANKDNGHLRLLEGLTPDSIIGWLVNNDVQSNPTFRQYLAVTLAGGGASAAYTGIDASNFKGHLTGPQYAIAGNILNGLDVLDDMETQFLLTSGPLEEKLMAALQGAKRVGADLRCTADGKSAISSFIRVFYPGDGPTPFLFLEVPTTSGSTDPIDVLQGKFDDWKLSQLADPALSTVSLTPDTLPASGVHTATIVVTPKNQNDVTPIFGASVAISNSGAGTLSAVVDNGDGTFTATLTAPTSSGDDTLSATVTAGGVETPISATGSVHYYVCGDADASGSVNIGDVTYLIARIFGGGPGPIPEGAGDADGSGSVNIADVTYLIARIFNFGPTPQCPPL